MIVICYIMKYLFILFYEPIVKKFRSHLWQYNDLFQNQNRFLLHFMTEGYVFSHSFIDIFNSDTHLFLRYKYSYDITHVFHLSMCLRLALRHYPHFILQHMFQCDLSQKSLSSFCYFYYYFLSSFLLKNCQLCREVVQVKIVLKDSLNIK